MAECTGCGKTLKSWQSALGGTCDNCQSKIAKQVKVSDDARDLESNKPSSQTASEGSTPAATAFTSLAWIIVALTFICTLIVTFATAADGDAFLAMIMFISGCFSAVLLGLLTEISANIAKLVNNSR